MFFVGLSPFGLLENVCADALVFVIGFRIITHKWVWDAFKKKPPWGFEVTPSGWSFNGEGFNPLDTFKRAMDDLSGRNKPIAEIVKDEVHNESVRLIREETAAAVASVLDVKGLVKVEVEKLKRGMNEKQKKLD